MSKSLLFDFTVNVFVLFLLFPLSFLLPAGLNNLKVNVTHRMNSTTFAAIIKLGSGLKKKAKKKKGKPGKVRIQLSNYNSYP